MLSVHCHNDLGLAVANSLAALQEGARQVECTINGIGERAGNTPLEEIVMALRTRQRLLRPDDRHQHAELLYPTSRMLSHVTGMQVQRNKAIVGQNAFAHEAGIHQDGMLKERSTYEIMKPEDVGIPRTELVLGKHSGRHALRQRVADLGYHLTDEQLQQGLRGVQGAGRPQEGDLRRRHRGAGREPAPGRRPATCGRWSGSRAPPAPGRRPSAAVTLRHQDGTVRRDAAVGDGPIDALFKAIDRDHRRRGEGGRLPRPGGDARTWTPRARRTSRSSTAAEAVAARAVSTDIDRGERPGVPGGDQPHRRRGRSATGSSRPTTSRRRWSRCSRIPFPWHRSCAYSPVLANDAIRSATSG